MIVELMVQAKLIEKPIAFEEFVDPRFADHAADLKSSQFEAGQN